MAEWDDIAVMKIKEKPKKKKVKFLHDGTPVEEKGYNRLPQLNKFFNHRKIYGFGGSHAQPA